MASPSTLVCLQQKSQNVTLPEIPELFNPNFLDVLLPGRPTTVETKPKDPQATTNPLINALKSSSNHTRTANFAPAYNTTGSATLNAFNSLNRWSFDEVKYTLDAAWAEDSAATLRLIWNIRSIHDGKGEQELFYRAFGWLYDNHPRTAISNLHMLVTPICTTSKKPEIARPHGYWKDLLQILALATCNQLSGLTSPATFLHNFVAPTTKRRALRRRYNRKIKNDTMTPAERQANEASLRARASEKRKKLYTEFHDRLLKKLATDPKYKTFNYVTTPLPWESSKTIDKAVNKDQWFEVHKSISLAGKWAPSPAGAHDRVTNISTAICQLLFAPNENSGPMAILPLPSAAPYPIVSDSNNCDILRRFYARWILKPLRKVVGCPEPLMSANRWTEIRYQRVPSICMAKNKEHFLRHDFDGFQDYLIDVESGKKLSGATMMPHELLIEAIRLKNADTMSLHAKYPKLAERKAATAEQEMKVVEAQWRSMIARMKESGTLDNSLAICDVSGSMGSINSPSSKKYRVDPIQPAVALSLVLASINRPPFNAGFITFSRHPEFFRLDNIEETSLATIAERASVAPWEMNTDFRAVFLDLLLPLAQKNHVAKDDMVKRLFVFSDMQFDNATTSSQGVDKWETNHDIIEKAYKNADYDVPDIVYWNLSGGRSTYEVQADRKGVAMMSGFSPAMMKTFMGEAEEDMDVDKWTEITESGDVVEKKEDEFTPLNVMKKALFRKSFDGLVVVD